MKKISFSELYGLQQAVIARIKTMTRRVDKRLNDPRVTHISEWGLDEKGKAYIVLTYLDGSTEVIYPAYQICEEVAVAQRYEAIGLTFISPPDTQWGCTYEMQGYSNKMFVRADLMPHRIRITDLKVERLQDISEEDAMREGVFKYDKPPLHHECDMFAPWPPYIKPYKWDSNNLVYRCTARYAFAYLIDKISGGGTWKRNPLVFAYTFELIK